MNKTDTQRQTFSDWLDSLPYNQRPQIIERIKVETKVETKQKFSNWKNGKTVIPLLARPIIDKIAGQSLIYSDQRKNNFSVEL